MPSELQLANVSNLACFLLVGRIKSVGPMMILEMRHSAASHHIRPH